MSSEISSLTATQEIILVLVAIPSELASILGSSLIIYLFLKSQHKTPYKRILLGMSIADIVITTSFVLQPWLVPSETSQRALARGNEETCTFLGFMWQISYAAFLYNGSLSFYYLLTIRLGIPERELSRRFEPAMHIVSVGFPLVTAIVGVVMGIYSENELGYGCWINDYPKGCGDDEGDTEVNCLSDLLAWVFGGIPVFVMLLAVLINNLVIYLYVRRTIYRTRRRSTDLSLTSSGLRRTAAVDSQTKRVREVATQATLYVSAFLFTYFWVVSVRIIESMGVDAENEHKLFPLYFLMSLFSPLTGFLNLMVYLRPRYLRTRGDFPQERRVWAVRRALFGDVVEPEEAQRRPATTPTVCNEPPTMAFSPTSNRNLVHQEAPEEHQVVRVAEGAGNHGAGKEETPEDHPTVVEAVIVQADEDVTAEETHHSEGAGMAPVQDGADNKVSDRESEDQGSTRALRSLSRGSSISV